MTATHTLAIIDASTFDTLRKLDGSGGYSKVHRVREINVGQCEAGEERETEAFYMSDPSHYEIRQGGIFGDVRVAGPFWVVKIDGHPHPMTDESFKVNWEML